MVTKIYVLTEPDGRIRYVGKTAYSLRERFSGHLSAARRGEKGHRCDWIRSLLKVGRFPMIEFIGEVEGDGCKEEIAWILYFKEEGISLVNNTIGGDGIVGLIVTAEHRQRMKESAKKRWKNPDEREKARTRKLGRVPSLKAKENHKIGMMQMWSNPIERKKRCVSNKLSWDEDRKRKYGEKMKVYWDSHPEEKEKRKIRWIEHNPRRKTA